MKLPASIYQDLKCPIQELLGKGLDMDGSVRLHQDQDSGMKDLGETSSKKINTRARQFRSLQTDDISEYLMKIRKKHFMGQEDSILPQVFELIGYDSKEEKFKGKVPLIEFINTSIRLS